MDLHRQCCIRVSWCHVFRQDRVVVFPAEPLPTHGCPEGTASTGASATALCMHMLTSPRISHQARRRSARACSPPRQPSRAILHRPVVAALLLFPPSRQRGSARRRGFKGSIRDWSCAPRRRAEPQRRERARRAAQPSKEVSLERCPGRWSSFRGGVRGDGGGASGTISPGRRGL